MKKSVVMLLAAILFSVVVWRATRLFLRAPSQSYTVVQKTDQFEVRAYPKATYAQITTYNHILKDALRSGFRSLFSYITAKDSEHEKIAMTSPVLFQPVGKSWTTRFVLPDSYTAETAPQPRKKEIRIVEDGLRRVAVMTVPGAPQEKEWFAAAKKLREALRGAGLNGPDSAWFARYDAPWVPTFLRCNEVMIEVE